MNTSSRIAMIACFTIICALFLHLTFGVSIATASELEDDSEGLHYTLSVHSHNGNVTGVGEYAAGSEVVVEAISDLGYGFAKWTDLTGVEVSTNNPYYFIMPEKDVTLVAHFTATYQLDESINPMGNSASNAAILPCNPSVALGSTIQFTAQIPDFTGEVIWSVVGSGSITADGLYTAPSTMPVSRRVVVRATATGMEGLFSETTVWLVSPVSTAGLSAPVFANDAMTALTGDMTGNGKADIVKLGRHDIYILENDGTGNFTENLIYSVERNQYENPLFLIAGTAAVGDMTNNGSLDIVFCKVSEDMTSFEIRVLVNDGEGNFTLSESSAILSGIPRDLILADFNGDGGLDVAYTTNEGISIRYGNGTGGFEGGPAPFLLVTSGLVAGDLTGNGLPDLVTGAREGIASGEATTLFVMLNEGQGSWSDPVEYVVEDYPNRITLGDFTGDGWLDVVTSPNNSPKAYLLTNAADGSGSLGAPRLILEASGDGYDSGFRNLRPVHLNSDGNLDLIGLGSGGLFIMPGGEDGTFGTALWSSNMAPLAASSARLLEAADFTGDGRVDLVTTSMRGTHLWAGTESSPYTFNIEPQPHVNVGASHHLYPLVLNATGGALTDWSATAGSFTDTSGYIAPTTMPAEALVTVTATLNGDVTKVATREITLTDIKFVKSGFATNKKVYDLTFDPVEPQDIYAAAEDGVYYSADGGQTSVLLGTGLPGSIRKIALSLDTVSGHKVLLAQSRDTLSVDSVYRYDLSEGISGAWQLIGEYSDLTAVGTSTVYVTKRDGNYKLDLYKATDGGLNFSLVSTICDCTIYQGEIDLYAINESSLYQATVEGLFYSSDGGLTWESESRTEGLNNISRKDGKYVTSIMGLVWDRANPQTMYTGIYQSPDQLGLTGYRSTNGGQAWQQIASLPLYLFEGLSIDPLTSSILYARGSQNLLFKSIDGGLTWFDIGSSLPAIPDINTVAVSPAGSEFIFLGTNTGVYVTGYPPVVPQNVDLTPGSINSGDPLSFTFALPGQTDTLYARVSATGQTPALMLYIGEAMLNTSDGLYHIQSTETISVEGTYSIALFLDLPEDDSTIPVAQGIFTVVTAGGGNGGTTQPDVINIVPNTIQPGDPLSFSFTLTDGPSIIYAGIINPEVPTNPAPTSIGTFTSEGTYTVQWPEEYINTEGTYQIMVFSSHPGSLITPSVPPIAVGVFMVSSDGSVEPPVDECFIATACFGSKYQPSVVLLRQFRDQYLLTNALGQALVAFYYKNSPPLAAYIAQNEGLKIIVRGTLTPIIGAVYLVLHPEIAYLLAGILLISALIWLIQRRKIWLG